MDHAGHSQLLELFHQQELLSLTKLLSITLNNRLLIVILQVETDVTVDQWTLLFNMLRAIHSSLAQAIHTLPSKDLATLEQAKVQDLSPHIKMFQAKKLKMDMLGH